MSETVIEFQNFGFHYEAQAEPTLYDINLVIRKGEKVLVAGPSGCGKSTLVHCINGLIPFSYEGTITGSLKLAGKETREQSLFEISAHVGTVLQDTDGQFVGMTVAEDIAFALENQRVEEPDLHQRVLGAARLVHVEDHLDHAPEDLSGGQKQRVSMAGILVDHVDLLLFDEPLANLDPATGKEAMELIDDIQKKTGAAVVIVEHRLEDVLHRDVDRIVLMRDGRIVFDGIPDVLLASSLLAETGIREPLYVTALKYAGVSVTEDMQPHSIRSLNLSGEDKKKVTHWFRETQIPPSEKHRESMLKAEKISFAYSNGFQALDKIDFEVMRGELIAIVGKNGAGKSTFSKVVCGFEKEQEGRLTFLGEDLSKLSIKERADRIGYVMQNPNQMISNVMVSDEVGFGLRMRGFPDADIEEKTGQVLKICGLWPFRKWPVSALSFGQKKRLTVASILTLDPQLIILDEPTAGQDYRHYTDIMTFLTELNRRGITIIMITHDMHLMLEYAQRSVVFANGQVIADDTGANILTDEGIVRRASLRGTSLYDLAVICGIRDPRAFVQRFIDYEREVVRK